MRPRINRYRTNLNSNNPPTSTSTGTQKCTSVSTLFSQLRGSLFVGLPVPGVTVIVGAIIAHGLIYNTWERHSAGISWICPRCSHAIFSLVRWRD